MGGRMGVSEWVGLARVGCGACCPPFPTFCCAEARMAALFPFPFRFSPSSDEDEEEGPGWGAALPPSRSRRCEACIARITASTS